MNFLQSSWSVSELSAQVWVAAGRFFAAAVVFVAFWILGKISKRVILRISMTVEADLLVLLARSAKAILLVFGAVTALGTAGINVSALVAGLGLTGFALGFAFRDILSNYLAGILLLLYRPFSRGDRIAVTGLEGNVSGIDLRYTVLRNNGSVILIPNSNLFTNPITISGGAEPHPVSMPR